MEDAWDEINRCLSTSSPSSHCHHSQMLMHKMNTYLYSGQLCDIVLIAGQQRIPAHRVVLSAASDYFSAMFMSDLRESQAREIELKDIDPEAVKLLIGYMYTGRLELREDTIEGVLSAACLLQLDQVKDACCKFLIKQLHPSNCIGIRQFADAQGCDHLHRIAHNFVLESFVDVMHNQEFVIMPLDDLMKLLASDDLNVESEQLVYDAVIDWVKYDVTERKQHLAHLLALVRLPLLSPQFLAEHVCSNALVQEDRQCLSLVLDAMTYHAVPQQRASFPSSRSICPRKSTVGVLFAIGGMDSVKGATCIEKYDLRTNTWSQVGHMSGRKLQFGVAVIDGKIYVVGGRDGLKTLNSVECFEPQLKTWTLMPPMATHRHGLGVAVLEGPMYAVGGHDGWSYLNTVERWDPQSKQWSFVAQMSVARSTAGVTVLGGKLYAVGGRDGSSCLRSMECFDPHTNKWVLCSPMSRRRGGVGVTTCSGYLYAVGGHDAPASNPSSSRFDCVERYDPTTDTWTMVASISLPRDGVGVCTLGDKLFAVGGYDGQNYSKEVECFDPVLNEWTKVASLCTGRAGACVVHYRPSAR